MGFRKEKKDGYTLIKQDNGPDLSMADVRIIVKDGLVFKDLAGTGLLYPYEDWRLDSIVRAKDLAGRLSIEQIAGLMLYSSHQVVPGVPSGPFTGHYDGKSREEAGREKWDLTDEQKEFLKEENIRHVLLNRVSDAETSARWSNELQKECEKLPFGIPVNISTDPRHGAPDMSTAEYKNSGSGVSVWPEGIGFTAADDIEMVKKFARTAAIEYRAMGITTELGPQIDLATEPRWMRLEGTPGTDEKTNIDFVRAYCDGLQGSWGKDSVVAMVKHWPGGGTGEGGRDAHYPFGQYAVYPGDNFESGLRVFTEGAFKLDGPTQKAGAVMPYYTVSWGQDTKNGENVGNSYSEYIIKDLLREKYGYDNIVCTDWGITGIPRDTIDSFGARCYGVHGLTEAEQHLRIIMNGVDQFGGNNRKGPIVDGYAIGCERYGEEAMRKRMEESAVRLLVNIFRLGLFEDPFLDAEESRRIVGNATFREEGRKAQAESVILLKDTGVLPLRKGMKIYVPDRHISSRKNFFRGMDPAFTMSPIKKDSVKDFFELTDDPALADAALVIMESPASDPFSSEDLEKGGNGYLPISLQYRPYTATSAREHSIAGGDPRDVSPDRSYRGKTNTASNESDLDNLLNARKRMGDKPVIACLRMHNPTVMSEFEKDADAIIAEFGVELEVLLEILFGERVRGGKLPYSMPKDMDTVEAHCEDLPDDYEPYTDSLGNTYSRGYSLKG